MGEMRPELYSRSRFRLPFQREQAFLWVGSTPCFAEKILPRLFSSEGYEVDVVPGGVAGVEMLRRRPPSEVVFDLP
jgi:hypothetical protein